MSHECEWDIPSQVSIIQSVVDHYSHGCLVTSCWVLLWCVIISWSHHSCPRLMNLMNTQLWHHQTTASTTPPLSPPPTLRQQLCPLLINPHMNNIILWKNFSTFIRFKNIRKLYWSNISWPGAGEAWVGGGVERSETHDYYGLGQ